MNRNTTDERSSGAGFFLILTFLFLGISVWQTSQGYELLLGSHLAWFFSFAIGLMMLFLAFEMRKRRTRGEKATGPLLGYIACAIFCFFGNFNAIYSRYSKEELYKIELQQHKQELTAVTTSAMLALKKADTLSVQLKKNVEEHKGQLIRQILDPSNSGLGSRAQQEIQILESLLKQTLTRFSGDPQTLANSYRDNIDQILNSKLSGSRLLESEQLIRKVSQDRDSTMALIDEAMKPQNIGTKGQNAIYRSVDMINHIGTQTENFVGKQNFNFNPVEFENQELGKISYSLKSAFNGKNTAAAFITILLAIGIDALVPFVIFVGTRRPYGNDKYDDRSGERGGVVILR